MIVIILTSVVSLRVYNAKFVSSRRTLLLNSLSLMALYSDRMSFHREVYTRRFPGELCLLGF